MTRAWWTGCLDRIQAEGPLRSQDFESEGARGPWWDWKPAKSALEYLFHSGRLMVRARPGFQKLYELRERVLPATVDASFPGDEDMADWYVRRAASALGVFSARDLAYSRKDGTKLLPKRLSAPRGRRDTARPHRPRLARPGEARGAGRGSEGGTVLAGSLPRMRRCIHGRAMRTRPMAGPTWTRTSALYASCRPSTTSS
jgi:hypothetical protein